MAILTSNVTHENERYPWECTCMHFDYNQSIIVLCWLFVICCALFIYAATDAASPAYSYVAVEGVVLGDSYAIWFTHGSGSVPIGCTTRKYLTASLINH